MRIKFACPHCDHVCRVPAELAGKQGRCPECLKGLEVLLNVRETFGPSARLKSVKGGTGVRR